MRAQSRCDSPPCQLGFLRNLHSRGTRQNPETLQSAGWTAPCGRTVPTRGALHRGRRPALLPGRAPGANGASHSEVLSVWWHLADSNASRCWRVTFAVLLAASETVLPQTQAALRLGQRQD